MKKRFIPANTRHPIALLQWFCRDLRLKKKREALTNSDFSIISNNCLGALIAHDYYQPFLSPTVNMFMLPEDFVDFCFNLKKLQNKDITEVTNTDKDYPVGLLSGYKLFFMHYKSFEDARSAWLKRIKRINFNNLLFLMVERDGCTYEDLQKFDKLPYDNKVAIVHKPYPEITCSIVIPGFDEFPDVGRLTDWTGVWGGAFL